MNYPSDNNEQDCISFGKIIKKECLCKQSMLNCPSTCKYFVHENYRLFSPRGLELTEVGRGKVVNFAEDLFLPNIYHNILCHVSKFEISIVSISRIHINIMFSLEKATERDIFPNELYFADSWKIKDIKLKPDINAPLIAIYTCNDEPVKLCGGKYKLNELEQNSQRFGNHLCIWFPFSKTKIKEKDVTNSPEFFGQSTVSCPVYEGEHIFGKNNFFWGSFALHKNYEMNFDCYYPKSTSKNDIIPLSIGILLPFPLVQYDSLDVLTSEEIEVMSSKYLGVHPQLGQEERMFAIPLEENTDTIWGGIQKEKDISFSKEPFHTDPEGILLYRFEVKVKAPVAVSPMWNEYPIALSIYSALNNLFEKMYSPAKLVISNKKDNLTRIRISSQIEDISSNQTFEITLSPHEVKTINIAPSLNSNTNLLSEKAEKIMSIKVHTLDGQILLDDSHAVTILPREDFLHSIGNNEGDFKVNLDSYIARWVTPHAECIDTIIANAGKEADTGMVGSSAYSIDKKLLEIKAIYDVLSKDISYVNRPLSFEPHAQRICLPSTTMKYRSGNCIDLSVLLASCFESLRYDVQIAMLKQHAFVKIVFSDSHYECIEATYLGRKEFSEAITRGRELYDENFTKEGNPQNDGVALVSINLSRKAGILPME